MGNSYFHYNYELIEKIRNSELFAGQITQAVKEDKLNMQILFIQEDEYLKNTTMKDTNCLNELHLRHYNEKQAKELMDIWNLLFDEKEEIIQASKKQEGDIDSNERVKACFEQVMSEFIVDQIYLLQSKNKGMWMLCSQKSNSQNYNEYANTIQDQSVNCKPILNRRWIKINTKQKNDLLAEPSKVQMFKELAKLASEKKSFKYQILKDIFIVMDSNNDQYIEIAIYEDSPYVPLSKIAPILLDIQQQLFKDIVEALFFMHCSGITHNNISLSSIFFDEQIKSFVLGDLSSCTNIKNQSKQIQEQKMQSDISNLFYAFEEVKALQSQQLPKKNGHQNKIDPLLMKPNKISLYLISDSLYEQLNIIGEMRKYLSFPKSFASPILFLHSLAKKLDIRQCTNIRIQSAKDHSAETVENQENLEEIEKDIEPKDLFEVSYERRNSSLFSERKKEDFKEISKERFRELMKEFNQKCILRIEDQTQLLEISSTLNEDSLHDGVSIDIIGCKNNKLKVVGYLQVIQKYLFTEVGRVTSLSQSRLEVQGDDGSMIKMNLGEYLIQGEELFIFMNIASEQTYFSFQLQSTTISDKLMHYLAHNKKLQFLSHLQISKCIRISSEAVCNFIDNCPSPNLTFLDLSDCPLMSSSILDSLAASTIITSLSYLSISNCHLVEQESIERFCNSFNAVTLSHFDLSGLSIPEVLFTSQYTQNIQTLILKQCVSIPIEIFSLLSNKKSFNSLRKIVLSGSIFNSSNSSQSLNQTFQQINFINIESKIEKMDFILDSQEIWLIRREINVILNNMSILLSARVSNKQIFPTVVWRMIISNPQLALSIQIIFLKSIYLTVMKLMMKESNTLLIQLYLAIQRDQIQVDQLRYQLKVQQKLENLNI